MIDFHLHLRDERGYLDGILRAYDRAGIEKGVAFGLGRVIGELENPGTLRLAARHKDRLVPFAFLRLGKDSPRTVARMADQGFRGFKVTWPTGPYDDRRFWPVYAAVQRAGLPILFHTGIVLRSRADARRPLSSLWMRPAALDLVARRFPRLKMVAAHLGGPWFDEAFMMARLHPNLWLDVSAGSGWIAKGMDARYFRRKLAWWGGVSKLVFATDQPHTVLTVARRVSEWKGILRALRPSREAARAFWDANARHILS